MSSPSETHAIISYLYYMAYYYNIAFYFHHTHRVLRYYTLAWLGTGAWRVEKNRR